MSGILSDKDFDEIIDELSEMSKNISNKHTKQFADKLDDIDLDAKRSLEELDFDKTKDSIEEVHKYNVDYTPEQIIELTGIDIDDVLDRYSKNEFKVFPSTIEQLKGMKFVTIRPITYSSEIGVGTESGIFISASVLDKAKDNIKEGKEAFEYGEVDLIKGKNEFRIVTPEEKELLGKVEKEKDDSKSKIDKEKLNVKEKNEYKDFL